MYKLLQNKIKDFHEVCNKTSEFRTVFKPFYEKDFYKLQKEIKKEICSPYILFFLDDENLDSIYEFDRDLPDYFSFRICGKLKNSEHTADYYETRYLYFHTEIDKNRLEIYSVNNRRTSVDSFHDTNDKYLINSIQPSEYNIEKIRSILVTYLSEEIEYLTNTFAVEANDQLNFDPKYAQKGNEIYQIIT